MSIDVIGNFLTIIRNGIMASKSFVVIPSSKMKFEIGLVLKKEGFIRDCQVLEEQGKQVIKIVLKYAGGESVIHEITRVSSPARRFYAGTHEIKPVIGNLGVAILTTNRGILTHKQAREFGVGGEVICTVW
ncbi:MAG TPA: 30S ribosomal protein S8 [Candidatus Babeliales bacterium]|nr:30S ribosomal protein S8 [Candidatus Babeliales bacterium]